MNDEMKGDGGQFSGKSAAVGGRYRRASLAISATVVLILGGYIGWSQYLSPAAKESRYHAEQIDKFIAANQAFEDAMRADTWGGKTPRETLDLFIEALKKGDIDLAAKYFQLETNDKDPNYLTRKKWEEGLQKTQRDGKITDLVAKLENAEPAGSSASNVSGFEIRDRVSGALLGDVGLMLNKYSNVWKIESI